MAHILSSELQFIEGRAKMREQDFEAAIDFFADLVQSRVEKYGDDSLLVAPAWLEYGSALLRKEEENPSDDLLGAAAAEAKRQAAALGEELGGGAEEDDDEEDGDEDDDNEEAVDEDDDGGDMQVAWECLEVARKILEKNKDDADAPFDVTEMLAEVFERLGDLQKFNGAYNDAISEYRRCLELREATCKADDRALADAHFKLAVAHIYNSGEEGVDAIGEKKNAMKHYRASRDALVAGEGVTGSVASTLAAADAGTGAATDDKEADDRKNLSDELEETIKALNAEIKAAMQAAFNAAASSSSSGGANGGFGTTIGFGAAASGSSSVGFGASSASSSSAVQPVAARPVAASSSSSSSSSGASSGASSSLKSESRPEPVDADEQPAKRQKTEDDVRPAEAAAAAVA